MCVLSHLWPFTKADLTKTWIGVNPPFFGPKVQAWSKKSEYKHETCRTHLRTIISHVGAFTSQKLVQTQKPNPGQRYDLLVDQLHHLLHQVLVTMTVVILRVTISMTGTMIAMIESYKLKYI